MFFSWQKNKKEEEIPYKKNNSDLIKELKEKGIVNKNILDAIRKVPRERSEEHTSELQSQ